MYDTKKEQKTDEALLEAEIDNIAVDEFAKAMKEKLAKARAKGRSGWDNKDTCSDERLVYLFFKHLKKANDGNFVDLANFLMFLHMRDTKPNVLNLLKDLFKVDFEAELEEVMKPKSCEGCKYQIHKVDDVQQNGNWMKYSVFYDCGHDNNCKRNTADRYEPTEK